MRGRHVRWSKRRKQRHASSDGNIDDGLLLHRICDVMLKAVKTGRPLIHLIKAWAIVGPHLIEVIIITIITPIHNVIKYFMAVIYKYSQ